MLSLNGINDALSASTVSRIEETNKKIMELQDSCKRYSESLSHLQNVLPGLVKGLGKAGLGIARLSYTQSGNGDVWQEGTTLTVSVQAEAISGKFKFIHFNGYTSCGEGKKQDRLDKKARKIEEAVKVESGLDVQVNPYSLELRGNIESRLVSVRFSIL